MDCRPAVDFATVARELGLSAEQVRNVTLLLDEGNTVPFITRYRKERTGNLNEEQIRAVQLRVNGLRQLAERAQTILRLIESRNQLTPELKKAIEEAPSLKRLEDLYLPYRPKRRSRATVARERGLEPLAELIWNPATAAVDLQTAAARFVDPAREVPTPQEALAGAGDILAERIGEDADIRARCRRIASKTGRLVVCATKEGETNGQSYRDYFNYSEDLAKIPPHRALAINRGEKAGALRIRFDWDMARARTEALIALRLTDHRYSDFLANCVGDAVERLVHPSLERELRNELTDRASAQAIGVFARNLRNLLLQPPLAGQKVLAIDPGFRTGSKLAALDECGNPLALDTIFVVGSAEKKAAARARLAELLQMHDCRVIAIGNGTACRETEELVSETISQSQPGASYLIVNEAGASIYSTSTVARDEFPDLDATQRGTISIGRRLQDPLSELVKIEPQHIGVGMYQHDVSGKQLKEALDEVIESCVNYVGVDLNTASASLLRYVSGFNQLTARRVVQWREEHGRFASRRQLCDVPGIGEATFTQAAGFLKITGGDEPLDNTWIHPESYTAAGKLLARMSIDPGIVVSDAAARSEWSKHISQFDLAQLAAEADVGLPTLKDILESLSRPGRDPRCELRGPVFRQGILKLEDLVAGMPLEGTVLNVVDFGAFVDVGLKDSGLVHISQLSTRYVKDPHDVVAVGDVVRVWVLAIDHERRRVSLTLVEPKDAPAQAMHSAQPAAVSTGDA